MNSLRCKQDLWNPFLRQLLSVVLYQYCKPGLDVLSFDLSSLNQTQTRRVLQKQLVMQHLPKINDMIYKKGTLSLKQLQRPQLLFDFPSQTIPPSKNITYINIFNYPFKQCRKLKIMYHTRIISKQTPGVRKGHRESQSSRPLF